MIKIDYRILEKEITNYISDWKMVVNEPIPILDLVEYRLESEKEILINPQNNSEWWSLRSYTIIMGFVRLGLCAMDTSMVTRTEKYSDEDFLFSADNYLYQFWIEDESIIMRTKNVNLSFPFDHEIHIQKKELIDEIISKTNSLVTELRPIYEVYFKAYDEKLKQKHFSSIELIEARLEELANLKDEYEITLA